jgi:hypothetical protein
MSENTLAPISHAIQVSSLDDIDRMATTIAASGMFGIQKKEQAATLMMICIAEGRHPISALRRYHIIENKPSMRADAMQGDFQASGAGIIWHARTDAMVAATFFAKAEDIDDKAQKRAAERFKLMWKLSFAKPEDKEYSGLVDKIADLSQHGEETIIRTYADAEAKGLTAGKYGVKDNWRTSPRQMLTARTITEGVRLIAPGIIAGIAEENEARDLAEQTTTGAPAGDANPYAGKTIAELEALRDLVMAKNEVPSKELLGAISEFKCAAEDAKTPEKKPEPTQATKTPEKPAESAPAPAKAAKVTKPKPTEAPKQPEIPHTQEAEVIVQPEQETDFEEPKPKGNPFEHTLTALNHIPAYANKKVGQLSRAEIEKAIVNWAEKPEKQERIKSDPVWGVDAAALIAVWKTVKNAPAE